MAEDSISARIECLDGLRGIAAVWVLAGHALLLSGWRLPVLGNPDLGVDLFIMLSGFLMVFHYQLRAEKEPWSASGTWIKFWVRRYFRIAPLYYVMLTAALLLGPMLLASRNVIDHFLAVPPQLPERFVDSSLRNILLHLTFLFGLLPSYAYRTALPDWSLGLEMQFYAVFPALMVFIRRAGWVWGAAILAIVAALVTKGLAHTSVHFPMPSFLPLKLHEFLAGMLLAGAIGKPRSVAATHLFLAMVFVFQPLGRDGGPERLAVREAIVFGFFLLVLHRQLPARAGRLARSLSLTLGNRVFHWLGELSFGTYLFHLLLLQPIAAFTISLYGASMPPPARFAVVFFATAAVAYPLALLTYVAVERPGQGWGRMLLRKFSGKAIDAKQDVAEIIAAP